MRPYANAFLYGLRLYFSFSLSASIFMTAFEIKPEDMNLKLFLEAFVIAAAAYAIYPRTSYARIKMIMDLDDWSRPAPPAPARKERR